MTRAARVATAGPPAAENPADRPPSPVGRLTLVFALVGIGWAVADFTDLTGVAGTQGYLYSATALLAVGLFGSTTGIHLPDVRPNARVILLAVTVGVLVKAALITVVMYLAFREPAYLVLGVAVAQIDPLSVAALRRGSRLSPRGNAILQAWSSFDDPVTTLLTIYAAALALGALGRPDAAVGGDLASFLANALANVVFAAGVAVVWWLITAHAHRRSTPTSGLSRWEKLCGDRLPTAHNCVATAVLVGMLALATAQSLFLGVAAAGLFFRPRLGPWLDRATQGAFMLACVALGVLLVPGIEWWPGILLGIAAFGAQVLVALVLTRGLPRPDPGYLALSQQNGITAIILALVLERSFPGTAAVVAPAILVINTLHITATSVFTRVLTRRPIRVLPPHPVVLKPDSKAA